MTMRSILLSTLVLATLAGFGTPASAQHTGFGTSRIVQNEPGYKLDITYSGEIHLNDDDTDIRSISSGGYIDILENTRRDDRRLRIEPGSGGRLVYSYRLNGKTTDWAEADRAWYATMILRIARAGIDAEARAERFTRRGANALLDEVEAIGSSGVKTTYMLVLFDKARLSTDELVRAARVAQEIPSSGDRTRVLIASAEQSLGAFDAIMPYFDAIRSIPSSGDKTKALVYLAERKMLEEKAAYHAALQAGASIPSSGDRANFLVSLADSRDLDAEYLDVVSTVPSSGDKTKVLLHLVERRLLASRAMYEAAMHTAATIPSSGDRARFLTAAAPAYLEAAREAFFDAVRGIPSSGDKMGVLIALLDDTTLEASSLAMLLETARSISSSGDKARVLIAAAPRVAGNDALVDVYLETANTISSSGDQKRALSALLN
ncbi:MAG: hypothetical protein R2834_23710 [Rhodothermales bacterium]